MSVEGRISITLSCANGGINQVRLHSTRPLAAAKVFVGKTSEQCLATVPLLFNICGNAQAYAAHGAIRQALGLGIHPLADKAQQLLVMLETVREHGWRILLDWPRFLGRPPDSQQLAVFMQLNQRIKPLLFKQGEAFLIDSQPAVQQAALAEQISHLESLIDERIFQGGLQRFLELETEAQLLDWINQGSSLPARLLSSVYRQGWAGIGQNTVGFLPGLDSNGLQQHLLQQPDFSLTPLWFGRCYETGPLSRQHARPLLLDLSARYRNGLLCRMIARLSELAAMPAFLRHTLAQLDAAQSREVLYTGQQQGWGLAQVQAARGLLIHQVRLSRGQVEQYQIVAPTEWNFHPDGVVAASLRQLRAADKKVLKQQAEWLINAIDPCVQYEIGITTDEVE